MECCFCGLGVPIDIVSTICDYAGIPTSIRLAISAKSITPAVIPVAASSVSFISWSTDPVTLDMLKDVEEKSGLIFRIRSLTMNLTYLDWLPEQLDFMRRHSEHITNLGIYVSRDIVLGSPHVLPDIAEAAPRNVRHLRIGGEKGLLEHFIPRVAHSLKELSYFEGFNEGVDWTTITKILGPLRLSRLQLTGSQFRINQIPTQVLEITPQLEICSDVPMRDKLPREDGIPWHRLYTRVRGRERTSMYLSHYVGQWAPYEKPKQIDQRTLRDIFLLSLPPDRPVGPFSEEEFLARILLLGDLIDAYENARKDTEFVSWLRQQAALLMGPCPSLERRLVAEIAIASGLNTQDSAVGLISLMHTLNIRDPLEVFLSFKMLSSPQRRFLDTFCRQLVQDPQLNYHRFDIRQSLAIWGGRQATKRHRGSHLLLWKTDLSEEDKDVLRSGSKRYSSFRYWSFFSLEDAELIESIHQAGITLPTPDLEFFIYRAEDFPEFPALASVIPEPDILLSRYFWCRLPCRPEFVLKGFCALEDVYHLSAEQATRTFLRLCSDIKWRRLFTRFGYIPIISILPQVEDWETKEEAIRRIVVEYMQCHESHRGMVDLKSVPDKLTEKTIKCLMTGSISWNLLLCSEHCEENVRLVCTRMLAAWAVWDPAVYRWRKEPLVGLLQQILHYKLSTVDALFNFLTGPPNQQRRTNDFLNSIPFQTAETFVSAMIEAIDCSNYFAENVVVVWDLVNWAGQYRLDKLLQVLLTKAEFLVNPEAAKTKLDASMSSLIDTICGYLLISDCFVSLNDVLVRAAPRFIGLDFPIDMERILLAIPKLRDFPKIRQWIFDNIRRPSMLVAAGSRLVPVALTYFTEELDRIFSSSNNALDLRLREWNRLFGIKNYWNEHMIPKQGEDDSANLFRLEQANITVDRKNLHDWYKSLPPAHTKLILRWGLSLLQRPSVPDEQLIWCLFDLLAALENWDGMLSTAISTEKAVTRGEWKLSGMTYWTAAMLASYKMGNLAKARKYAALMEFGPGAPLHYLGAEKVWKECYQPSPQPASSAAAKQANSSSSSPSPQGGNNSKSKKKQKQKQKQKEKEKEKEKEKQQPQAAPAPAPAPATAPVPQASSSQSSSSSAHKHHPVSAPLPRRQPSPSSSCAPSQAAAEENLKPSKTSNPPQKVPSSPTSSAPPAAQPSPPAVSPVSSAPASPSPAPRSKYVSPPAGVFYLQCSICYERVPDFALQCGHMFCSECVEPLSTCAVCRQPVQSKFRLFISSADEDQR